MSHSHDGHMFGSSDQADSAGQPWEGREFEENPFASDDGTTPEHLKVALDTFHALPLEGLVPDRQDLVDQQHIGIGVDRDREGQAHEHARRVELHLSVDEVSDAAEVMDVIELPVDLFA